MRSRMAAVLLALCLVTPSFAEDKTVLEGPRKEIDSILALFAEWARARDAGAVADHAVECRAVRQPQFDLDAGAYVNASVRVVGTQDPNAAHYGETRRCVNSTAVANTTTSRNTQLLFDAPYSNVIAAGDTIETLIPLPDEQCRYLQLKTAQACYQKKPAFDAMKALQPELAEEGAKFLQYATPPRDSRGPTFYRSPRFDPVPYDQNHRRNWWA